LRKINKDPFMIDAPTPTMPRRRPQSAVRLAAVTTLLAAVLTLAGCGVSALMYNLAPPTIEKEHLLPDRPTLVLVDDPGGELGDPALASQMAAHVYDLLIAQKVLSPQHAVQLAGINELSQEHGKDFKNLPVDEVGRELGAQQVVHVHVQAALWVPQAGMWKPTGSARVKVINVADGRRLFPGEDVIDGVAALPPRSRGIVVTELQPRASTNVEQTEIPAIQKLLANRLARDTARVFYDWQVDRDPGAKFKD
jgi:hypothetical protein